MNVLNLQSKIGAELPKLSQK